ncbi:MAG: hypothetical protein ABI823_12415 [Bryobacteraceae bacterium]
MATSELSSESSVRGPREAGGVWGRRLFLTGAWVMILCGVVHIGGHVGLSSGLPENETERQLLGLMRSYTIENVGRTMQELLNGFSLAFVFLPVTLGVLCLAIAKARDARLMRQAALVAGLGMAAQSAVGLTHWFWVPDSFLIPATLTFAAAWFLLPRERG